MIRTVIFDIGGTLVDYPIPLNWSALYRPAFESIAAKNGLVITGNEYEHIGKVLAKYNTRIKPREREVSSDTIFTEILSGTAIPEGYKDTVKRDFYGYFRRDANIFPDAQKTLAELYSRGMIIGTLSDVAYGMDNEFALEDIAPLLGYIKYPYTSNDTGYRKPCGEGLLMLSEKTGTPVSQMMFVGDEQKDMECARNAGAVGVLIDRTGTAGDFERDIEIKDLYELTALI